MSRRNDLLRLYNAPVHEFLLSDFPWRRAGLIQLLNYSRRPASDGPLFYVKQPHRSARLVSPEIARPRPFNGFLRKRWGGVSLPRISVYGALELEK